MLRQIRLKWQIAALFLMLGILLVVGYTMLAAHYFVLGMDNGLVANMERAARQYDSRSTTEATAPPQSTYTITRSWQNQPEPVQQAFDQPLQTPGVLVKARDGKDDDDRRGTLYFAIQFDFSNHPVFVSHQLSRETVSKLVHRSIRNNLNSLLVISVLTALGLGVVIWLVMRRVARPVGELTHWARKLDARTLKEPVPDFQFPELNELSGLIRASLWSLEDSLEREHRFLKHTSHELRTPISVIRNNVELIHSLPNDIDPVMAPIIERIDRASQTMKYLTETLLWLSREEGENLPTRHCQLDELIRQLLSEHHYLLRDKAVALSVTTEPATLELPDAATRIVIGNLIRNAFQHTWSGTVTIHQIGSTLHINNQQDEPDDSEQEDLGFGLGLRLTAELTKRLGWAYSNRPVPGGHQVTLSLRNMAIPAGASSLI